MTVSRRIFTWSLPALLAARPALAQSATMQLTSTASGDLDEEWMKLFKKNVEAASLGKLRANVYPGSQLGSGPTTVEGVALGTLEFAINASGLYEALEPRFAVFSIPGLYETMAQGQKLLLSPEARAVIDPIGRDKGVQVVTAMLQSPASIVSRRPIKTLADMKGMKIRVPGSASLIEQLKQVGAAPIAMSLGEVLPAFQNGTIDGVFAGTTIFTALKYYDLSKNLLLLPSSFLAMIGIFNSDFLSNLGPLEKVVMDSVRQSDVEAVPWAAQDVGNAEKIWGDNGGQTAKLSPEDAAQYLAAVIPAAMKALSPAGRKDYEALKAASAKVL